MSLADFVRLRAAAAALVAAASLAAIAAEAQPFVASPEAANVPAYRVGGAATPVQAVSMRAGPSTDTPVIGTLRPGMPLQILASANYGWMQVQTPVGTGWVYGSYLAPGSGGPMTSSGGAAPINGGPTPAPAPQPKPEISSP